MNKAPSLQKVAEKIEAALAAHAVQLTLGGEPTFVPTNPEGPEWSITALGPTKLGYAYALAAALMEETLRHAVSFYSPGKSYPGELNPRWALKLVWNRAQTPLVPALGAPLVAGRPTNRSISDFKRGLLTALRLKSGWLRAVDPHEPGRPVWVLPLDHTANRFRSANWKLGPTIELLRTDGPAGLRLPLHLVAEGLSRRALTLEIREGELHLFLPPLFQKPFLALLEQITRSLRKAKLGPVRFSGYLPSDETGQWTQLAIAADPGVLEINLPPCFTWQEYDWWMRTLETTATRAGLRSYKEFGGGETLGTGGGNHLLFGGPTLDTNPLFTHPRWVTSMLRYWQHHPSLSYLFTGQYVGPSSQAPRPDESASALYDLEMAYQFLESLPPGDHRVVLSETLRHLHTDGTGNSHRSETSFDKFWNVAADGGSRGLLEFRAIESLPHAEWMSAVALLWRALAAYLLGHPCTKPLIDHGERLHDYYFLPTCLWADFSLIIRDLQKAGFDLPVDTYRAIAAWRFPQMLAHQGPGGARLAIRKAQEGWPLLCETPTEGGTTSRFVDTSIERLEFVANRQFTQSCEVYVQGRRLPFQPFPNGLSGVGLRYRRSALYPSLHPGILPQVPLHVLIKKGADSILYKLELWERQFAPAEMQSMPALQRRPCKTLHAGLLTCDLRLP